jgi:NAD(P)-dependent dehydrogenase (short-subunit alcohol dehydrogenase family)
MAVVLVTGGSSGIGLATVKRLAASGDAVYSGSRTPAPAGASGGGVTHVPLDVADPDSCAAAISSVLDSAGRIDVLVNCAGTGELAALEDACDAAAHRTFEVNVFGPLRLIRAVLPTMRAQGSGRIVNVTSVNDIAPAPFGGLYSASKAALMSLSYVLGAELTGTGIFVTAVAPGLFRTPMAEGQRSQRAPEGSRYAKHFDGLARGGDAQLAGAGDPDDAGAAIEKLIRSDAPPARLVVGDDGAQIEDRVRRATPEEYAALLHDSVLRLSTD